MYARLRLLAIKIVAAVATGVLLRFVMDLRPVWWLVWIAPAALLAMAFRSSGRDARWMTTLAAAIGASVNFHYLRLVMPLQFVFLAIAAQTLLWAFLAMAARRLVVRYQAWWTALVYPVLWVAAETLMAALLPDGNWGSLAYSQSDVLPIVQVTALFGTSGLLFLIALVASTLALATVYGRRLKRGWIVYALAPLLLGGAIVYGHLRLRSPLQARADEVRTGFD